MKKISITILILSILIAVLPLLSVLLAGFLSSILGCDLNEGDVSMCPTVFGDIGELLYLMGVFGWFLFYTVPLGLCGLFIGVIMLIVSAVRSKKPSQ